MSTFWTVFSGRPSYYIKFNHGLRGAFFLPKDGAIERGFYVFGFRSDHRSFFKLILVAALVVSAPQPRQQAHADPMFSGSAVLMLAVVFYLFSAGNSSERDSANRVETLRLKRPMSDGTMALKLPTLSHVLNELVFDVPLPKDHPKADFVQSVMNEKDVSTIFESILQSNLHRAELEKSTTNEKADVVLKVRAMSRFDEVSGQLSKDFHDLGIEVTDDALAEIHQVIKTAGLLATINDLSEKTGWRLSQPIDLARRKLLRELLDLNFGVQHQDGYSDQQRLDAQVALGGTLGMALTRVFEGRSDQMSAQVLESLASGEATQLVVDQEPKALIMSLLRTTLRL